MFAERRTTKDTKSTKEEKEEKTTEGAMPALFVSCVLFVVQEGLVAVHGPKYPATLSLHRNNHSGFEHGDNGGNRGQADPLCCLSYLLVQ